MTGRCPPGESLSALLDQALTTQAREKVQRHLFDCADCRAELADLRRLRSMMTRPRPATGPTPSSLTDRLVGIAGDDASLPLTTRPFAATSGSLPTRHRRNRRMLLVATLLATTLVAFVGIGWAAAPPVRTAALTPEGQTDDLAAVLAALPLGMDASAAVLAISDQQELRATGQVPEPSWTASDSPSGWGRAEALAALNRAVRARQQVAVAGQQSVWIATPDAGTVHAEARVQRQPGQGSEVEVSSATGASVADGYLPATDDTIGIPTRHVLSGVERAGTLLDRPVSLVEARDPESGALEARWWLDEKTGLLLWQTVMAPDGRLVESAGFTSLTTPSDAFVPHLPARLTVSTASDVQLSMRGELSADGWSCASELAGLPLIRLRSDADGVQTVYSDGIDTVVVSQQQGALAAHPAGVTWDPALRAYRGSGPATELIWQSGTRVFTVTSFGSGDRLDQVVGLLPHDAPVLRTRAERVQDGWRRILTGR